MGQVSIPYCAVISDDDVTPSLNRGVCGKCEIYREGYVELFSGKTAMAGGTWHVSIDDEAISPFPLRRRAADSSRIWRVDLTRSKAIDANDDIVVVVPSNLLPFPFGTTIRHFCDVCTRHRINPIGNLAPISLSLFLILISRSSHSANRRKGGMEGVHLLRER